MSQDHSRSTALLEPQRNNYFYGKLLDVGHLEMEQRYFNRKRWLLNRLGLGAGVLGGLGVTIADKKLAIAAGVAIDGYGREIVVAAPEEIDPWRVVDADGKESELPRDVAATVRICIEYRECMAGYQPTLVTDCGPDPKGQPGTIRETYRLHTRDPRDARVTAAHAAAADRLAAARAALCDALASGADEAARRVEVCKALDALAAAPATIDPCVVLAEADLAVDGTIAAVRACETRTLLLSNEHLFDLVLCATAGAGPVAPAPKPLTTIVKMNWEHDRTWTENAFKDGLNVTFDGDMRATTPTGMAWFIVDVEYESEGKIVAERLQAKSITPTIPSPPPAAPTFERTARYVPVTDPLARIWDVARRVMVRVVIKCDFLLDQNGRAVDGTPRADDLANRTGPPSGSGTPGGDFTSWFFLEHP